MAKLPTLPKGKEFEEYISALFQCGGFYVERNIIEREEKEEILELDIVATKYLAEHLKGLIIEVKSGDWGFSDIFKVKGWLKYLDYANGLFITIKPKENFEFYEKKAKEIGVRLIQFHNLSTAPESLKEIVPCGELPNEDLDIWRFSYWIERNMLREIKHQKKCNPIKISYQKLDEYYFLLNSGIFFTESIVRRVHKLYETFQKFPHISAKCGNELLGESFDKKIDKLPEEIYSATYYDCCYNIIQISTFIEHRARLALLKGAIDYLLGKDRKEDREKKSFGIDFEKMLLILLPESFKKGMEQIKKHKFFYKYPLFWQWFMWFFGGFILKDYEEKEFEILSQKTGIPIEEIPNAFDSYQILFPIDDGWFLDLSPQSNIKLLKMFSIPFCGIGANYRRLIYTDTKKFEDLSLTMTHTRYDLLKWNNLTVEVLEKR
ncbi:MAG: hypothetical protein ACTSPV_16330 [Candidatus Hodarchaeales archaeon]